MSGNLYQLTSRFELRNGAYVAVNGPYDRYGVVIKSTPQPDGTFLNLIRGCPDKGQPVAAEF